MSIPQQPKPAKLVISLILKDKKIIEDVILELIKKFGPIDFLSPWISFDFTNYYEKEMGAGLLRRIIAFKQLVNQSDLADIKIKTNEIESRFSESNNRKVNIDPGYILLERFVLATGKNYSHRIYIGKGIYADLTLIYLKGKYQPMPWTYPDYAHMDIQRFIAKAREKYKMDLKFIDHDNSRVRIQKSDE
jgi:hypothetical protein